MLSALQKSRVRFHLGYPQNDAGGLIEVLEELTLDRLDPQVEFALVGNPAADQWVYLGEDLAAWDSHLAIVESAYAKLAPKTIDDSLFVKQAGSVTLRTDEYRARRQQYDGLRCDMASLLDVRLFGAGGVMGAY